MKKVTLTTYSPSIVLFCSAFFLMSLPQAAVAQLIENSTEQDLDINEGSDVPSKAEVAKAIANGVLKPDRKFVFQNK